MRRNRSVAAFSLFAFQDIITSVTGVILLITMMLALELIQKEKITDTPGRGGSEAPAAKSTPPDQIAQQVKQLKMASEELDLVLAQLTNTSVALLEQRRQSLQDSIEKLRLQVASVNSADTPTDANILASTELIEKEIEELRKELTALKSAKRVIYNRDPTSSKEGWVVEVGAKKVAVAKLDGVIQKAAISAAADGMGLAKIVNWARSRDNSKEYFVLSIRPGAIAQFVTLRDELEELGFDLGFDVVGSDAIVVKTSP